MRQCNRLIGGRLTLPNSSMVASAKRVRNRDVEDLNGRRLLVLEQSFYSVIRTQWENFIINTELRFKVLLYRINFSNWH